MTTDELTAATAVFESREAAQAAADAAMPRRIHRRPYAQGSGWHWARSVDCSACGAIAGADCIPVEGRPWYGLHSERQAAARAAGRAADRWIVCAPSNTVLLRDGRMYDYARKVTVRP